MPTGYSSHTENLTTRLDADHEVGIVPNGKWAGGGEEWNGIPIHMQGMGSSRIDSIRYWFEEGEYDVVISHMDHWGEASRFSDISEDIPFVPYTVVDQANPDGTLPRPVKKAVKDAIRPVFHSEWAYNAALETEGFDADTTRQIPHGIDIEKFAPVTETIPQGELKRQMGVPEDAMLYAIVGGNNGTRERLPEQMEAFSRLLADEDVDDAYLYVHAHPAHDNGHNLYSVRETLDIEDRCLFPDAGDMAHGIDEGVVVRLYNAADVVVNATKADSWGMVVTEAMASGTPVIAANHSALTEQFGLDPSTTFDREEQFRVTDYGLLVNRGSPEWTQRVKSRRFNPRVGDVHAAMRFYYDNPGLASEHGKQARERVTANYSLDSVYAEGWVPLLEEVANHLP